MDFTVKVVQLKPIHQIILLAADSPVLMCSIVLQILNKTGSLRSCLLLHLKSTGNSVTYGVLNMSFVLCNCFVRLILIQWVLA